LSVNVRKKSSPFDSKFVSRKRYWQKALMALNKLTDLKLESIVSKARKAAQTPDAKAALVGDGSGLYLSITKAGSASWLFRYMVAGKAHTVGLGGYPKVRLKIARVKAQEVRDSLANGIDPALAKKEAARQQKIAKSKAKTFDTCVTEYIELQRPSWNNAKHAQQWTNTLNTYASPVVGKMPIGHIDTDDVLKILKPIWTTKPETASRLRGRIESVLGWATVHGWRTGLNPARFKDHLEHLLPKRQAAAQKHHAAMPYAQIPAFIKRLETQDGMARYALEFLILCASRTGEVTGAVWSEFDFEKRLWTIPATRMKARIEHRVPLSDRALEILRIIKPFSAGEHVFNEKQDKAMSNMTMNMLLRRMEVSGITVHGFRSSFRDWVGEKTDYPFHVAEQALAHSLPNAVQVAYLRSDFVEKRTEMMRDWATFVATVPAKTSE
jgi:integrase